MKKYIFMAILTLSLLGCSSSNGPEGEGGGAIENPSSAPGFNLETLSGGNIKLSDYQNKVVFIFFVGYSCPPCIASAPITEKIYQEYKEEDFQALAIDVWDGGPAQVSAFKFNTGVSYPIALMGSATGSSYGVSNDFTVIIDKEGNLVYKSAGVNEGNLKDIIANLLKIN